MSTTTILLKIDYEGALRRVSVDKAISHAELCATITSMFFRNGGGSAFTFTYEDDEGDTITISSDAELAEAFAIFESEGRKSLRLTIVPVATGDGASGAAPAAGGIDGLRDLAGGLGGGLSDLAGLADLLPALLAQAGPMLAPIIEQVKAAHSVAAATPPTSEPAIHTNIACDGCTDGEGHEARAALARANGCVLPDGTIVGTRYKSAVVQDFDLCATCEQDDAFDTTHAPFLKINRPALAPSAIVAVIDDDAPGDAGHQEGPSGAALDQIHWGVSCDVSGMSPIVGKRFWKRGENYDLCESEFVKLNAEEQQLYECIEVPRHNHCRRGWPGRLGGHGKGGKCKGKGKGKGWKSKGGKGKGKGKGCFTPEGEAIHWGVSCDVSGMSPIVGKRFQKRGENYDVCEPEFVKLSTEEQKLYECIETPVQLGLLSAVTSAKLKLGGGCGGGWRGGCGKGRGGGGGPRGCNRGGRWRERYEREQREAEEERQFQMALQMSAQAAGGGGGAVAVATSPGSGAAASPHTVEAKLADLTSSGWQTLPPALQQQQQQQQQQTASAAPASRLLARFVSDVTYEDGRTVPCGTSFRKVWRLRNESTTAWPAGTRLQPVGGDDLDLPAGGAAPAAHHRGVAVAAAAPGTEVDVAVELHAPARAGRYVQYWRLSHSPHAHSRFGHRVWVDVTAEEPTPAPVPSQPEEPPRAASNSAFQDAVDAAAAEAVVAKAEGDDVDDLVTAACAHSLLEAQQVAQAQQAAPAAPAAPVAAAAPAPSLTVSAQIAQQILAQVPQEEDAAVVMAAAAAPVAPPATDLTESGWQKPPEPEPAAALVAPVVPAVPEPAEPVGTTAAVLPADLTESGWQQPPAAALAPRTDGCGSNFSGSDDLTRSGSWTSISASMIQQQQAQQAAAQAAKLQKAALEAAEQEAADRAARAEETAAQVEEQLAAKHALEARALAEKQQADAAAQAAELAARQSAERTQQRAAHDAMSPQEQFELALRLSVESAEADAARRHDDRATPAQPGMPAADF